MPAELPVIAAIPNYNMAAELGRLLPQTLNQGYAAIYVLDDASTDDSKDVAAQFAGDVTFISGAHNVGAGGNRNRILDVLPENEVVLIHFIDADTVIETNPMASLVRASVPDDRFAFVVGLCTDPDGKQNVWNYGPRPSLYNEAGAYAQHRYGKIIRQSLSRAASFHKRNHRLLDAWPDPLGTQHRHSVFWGIEQNLVFRSDIFRHYKGFDPSIRETEIIELSLRMARDGLCGYFDPRFHIRHTEAQVRLYNRGLRKRREGIRLAFTYGIIKWLTRK